MIAVPSCIRKRYLPFHSFCIHQLSGQIQDTLVDLLSQLNQLTHLSWIFNRLADSRNKS